MTYQLLKIRVLHIHFIRVWKISQRCIVCILFTFFMEFRNLGIRRYDPFLQRLNFIQRFSLLSSYLLGTFLFDHSILILNFCRKPLFTHTHLIGIKVKSSQIWRKWNSKLFSFNVISVDLSYPRMKHNLFGPAKVS